MKPERGDFVWGEVGVMWIESACGKWVIHPLLGPMKVDDPLTGVIIGSDLAELIDEELKKKLKEDK